MEHNSSIIISTSHGIFPSFHSSFLSFLDFLPNAMMTQCIWKHDYNLYTMPANGNPVHMPNLLVLEALQTFKDKQSVKWALHWLDHLWILKPFTLVQNSYYINIFHSEWIVLEFSGNSLDYLVHLLALFGHQTIIASHNMNAIILKSNAVPPHECNYKSCIWTLVNILLPELAFQIAGREWDIHTNPIVLLHCTFTSVHIPFAFPL